VKYSTLDKNCQTPCGSALHTLHTQKAGDTGCNDCIEGTYNADTTHYVATCSLCASGTYSSLKKATSCQDCPDDSSSPAGSTVKSDCTGSSDVKTDDASHAAETSRPLRAPCSRVLLQLFSPKVAAHSSLRIGPHWRLIVL